ncbi:hypothetical protein GHK92_12715 [Nocardioides sp. dk4132]|uniref:hypothetical protein n=1 Tax=unclassified Nocardioides TaxID=2615069 RepID=UPI001297C62C|nr:MULTISPECIES: hypothetical protein [unclassified Nocardioides]MQW76739.1 hypothetical protein [Nocardioides sp. dk4132]QGA06904.1 hypothetical protein GFH29_05505 [Nocardioides sp. dk884]
MTRRLAATTATFAALLALSACGTEESDSESGPGYATNAPKTDAAEAPSCSEVWKEGEKLAEDYAGCEDESGTYSAATWMTCEDPALEFTSYEDELYAKRGDTITSDPAAIKKLREDCKA